MTKPVVVLREDTAPTPVTYTQLDQNFKNLRDATHNYTVGSDTALVDLNSALTFTAGTGIALSLDTSGKILTISSSTGVDTNTISQGNSSVVVTDSGVGQIGFTVDGTNIITVTNSSGLAVNNKNITGIATVQARLTNIPRLWYQGDVGGSAVIPSSGSTYTIDLNSSFTTYRQTTWDVVNLTSPVTITINVPANSSHDMDLVFVNNGSVSKTLNLYFPVVSSSQGFKMFWSDGVTQTGNSTKTFTLDVGKIIWLSIRKVPDASKFQSLGLYTHLVYVDIKLNNISIP